MPLTTSNYLYRISATRFNPIISSVLLMLVGIIGAVLLALISYDRNVNIQDQARVLNTGRLQQTISDMPYDLTIVTIQHFNGSTDDFTRQYSVTDS